MKTIKPEVLIKELIQVKEAAHRLEGELLKDQFICAYESLKPINVIKNAFKEGIAASGIKTNAVDAVMGLTTGFIAKKIVTGKSDNPLINFAGSILEMIVASNVTKNASGIKSVADAILKKLIEQRYITENI
jgi:hypothetical protein